MVLDKSWMKTSLVESASDMKKQQSTKVLRLQGDAGWATQSDVLVRTLTKSVSTQRNSHAHPRTERVCTHVRVRDIEMIP